MPVVPSSPPILHSLSLDSPGGLGRPTMRELKDRAFIDKKSADLHNIKNWIASANKLVEKANVFYDNNDFESAYVDYLKASTIIVEIIPANSNYKNFLEQKTPQKGQYLALRSRTTKTYLPRLEEIAKILEIELAGSNGSSSSKEKNPGTSAQLKSTTSSTSKPTMTDRLLADLPAVPKHPPSATPSSFIHDRTPASGNTKQPPPVPSTSTKPSQWKPSSPLPPQLNRVAPVVIPAATPPPVPLSTFATAPPPVKTHIPTTETSFEQSLVISPQKLNSYLEKVNPPSILLLDVRPRDTFKEGFIQGRWVVNLEPLILKSGVTSMEIESSLILVTEREQSFFSARNNFDLIVYYDQCSTQIPSPFSQHPLANLIEAIYQGEFVKTLRRIPVLLVGGFDAWCRDIIGPNGNVGKLDESGEQMVVPGSIAMAAMGKENLINGAMLGLQPLANGANAIEDTKGAGFPRRNPTLADFSRNDVISRKQGREMAPMIVRTLYDYFNFSSTKQSMVQPNPSILMPPSYLMALNIPPTYPSAHLGASTFVPPPLSALPPSSSPAQLVSQIPRETLESKANGTLEHAPGSQISHRRNTFIDNPYLGFTHSESPMYESPPPVAKPNLMLPTTSQLHPSQDGQPASTTTALATSAVRPTRPLPSVPLTSTNLEDKRRVPTFDGSFSGVGNVSIGTAGLKNLGNTCFMNSVIQCLSGTVPLARFFVSGTYKKSVNQFNKFGTRGVLADAFAGLLRDMWSGQYTYVSPGTFREALNRFAPQFAGGEQHDSQEFLAFLLDGLHEDLNLVVERPAPQSAEEEEIFEEIAAKRPWDASALAWERYLMRNSSIIVSLFQGQYQNRMMCSECGKTSTTYDSFMYLSLPIPVSRVNPRAVTLDKCLDTFVKEETLSGEDAWHCPGCKTRRKATKQLTLSRLPDVLLIHLKRFSWKGPFRDKLETMVKYPLRGLDLTSYLSGPILRPEGDKAMPVLNGVFKYDLYAVSNHFGGINGGHYTACVRNGYHNQWHNFDDSRVSVCDESLATSRSAYTLFYVRNSVQ